MKEILLSIFVIAFISINLSCSQDPNESTNSDTQIQGKNTLPSATPQITANPTTELPDEVAAKITFIELGSVNCIPCKAMQPVMKSIENKYGQQIEIIFYDVWKPEQRHYARKYGIRLIPTQVFLDQNGNEIMRHEGFFPEGEIEEFLQAQGLKSNKP